LNLLASPRPYLGATLAAIVLVVAGCVGSAQPSQSTPSAVLASGSPAQPPWPCAQLDLLVDAGASLDSAAESLSASNAGQAVDYANKAQRALDQALPLTPKSVSSQDLAEARTKLLATHIDMSQVVYAILGPPPATRSDVASIQELLALTHTALSEARDAVAHVGGEASCPP
jgi:hypothetical protein